MRSSTAAAILCLGTSLIFGCSDDEPGPDVMMSDAAVDAGEGEHGTDGGPADATTGPVLTSLRIDPTMVRLMTDGTQSVRQSFTVFGTDEDGTETDVSAQATFVLADQTLGQMQGAEFVSGLHGGTTQLTASIGPLTTEATIILELKRIAMVEVPGAPMLPPAVDMIVAGAPDDPARAPTVVYPNEGVVVPPNLNTIEIHWRPGTGTNTLFALNLVTPLAELTIYTRCTSVGGGCVFNLQNELWNTIAQSARGLEPISVTVTGAAEDGSGAGTSAPLSISISAQPVTGAIYYWTTTAGGSILRAQFGSTAPPEPFFPFEGNTCFGCHALAPNGARMSLTVGGNLRADLALIDVGGRQVLLAPSAAEQDNFHAWDPTSERFAAVYSPEARADPNIRIRDGNSGLVLETINVGVEPDHPDWSPAGDRIIFTTVGFHVTSQFPGMGGLSYIQLTDNNWGTPQMLIAQQAGLNRYYPAYSPDATFFLYNESTCPGGQVASRECDADSDPSAKLWAMMADGGQPILLARANAPGIEDGNRTDLTNSYPKWAPFVDRRRADDTGKVMWMTFSSRRRYGLRAPSGSSTLLWMAAVDPDAVAAGDDPSGPAFALPFQDFATSNHIAQWVAQFAPDPGDNPGQCLQFGEPCRADDDQCCPGSTCADQGGDIFRCKPAL